MRNFKNNLNPIKTVLKVIVVVIIIILISVFSLSYTINKNSNYKSSIIKDIKANYHITEPITYANYADNYYILSTKDRVIVLTKEYQEVLNEDINNLSPNSNKYELIYKTKKLMYEETILKDNKVTYNYYDAKTYKKVSSTTLEK